MSTAFLCGYTAWMEQLPAIEITPVCEELLKLLPLLFYFLIFEPEPRELPMVAIAIAAGLQPLKMHAT